MKSNHLKFNLKKVLADEGVSHVPIWKAPPETEESKKRKSESTTEDTIETVDKSKLAPSSSSNHTNLRRKSSNIRGDMEGLHINDQNKEASGKLEQVS